MFNIFKGIRTLRGASPQTKFFAFNWFIYGVALVITTVYVFVRLDYVHDRQDQSQQPPNIQETFHENT